MSYSQLYTISLRSSSASSSEEPVQLTFEILPRNNAIVPPNMTEQEKLAWITMWPNEHPIRIVGINDQKFSDTYAVAYTTPLNGLFADTKKSSSSLLLLSEPDHPQTDLALTSIRFEGESFDCAPNEYFWWPTKHSQKGSSILRLSDKTTVLVKKQRGAIPFLDASGTFHYPAKIISRQTRDKWTDANTSATIFVSGSSVQAILDRDTHLCYSVERCASIKTMRATQTASV